MSLVFVAAAEACADAGSDRRVEFVHLRAQLALECGSGAAALSRWS